MINFIFTFKKIKFSKIKSELRIKFWKVNFLIFWLKYDAHCSHACCKARHYCFFHSFCNIITIIFTIFISRLSWWSGCDCSPGPVSTVSCSLQCSPQSPLIHPPQPSQLSPTTLFNKHEATASASQTLFLLEKTSDRWVSVKLSQSKSKTKVKFKL